MLKCWAAYIVCFSSSFHLLPLGGVGQMELCLLHLQISNTRQVDSLVYNLIN